MAPSPSPQAVAPATTPLSARPEVRGRRRGGMGLSEGGEERGGRGEMGARGTDEERELWDRRKGVG